MKDLIKFNGIFLRIQLGKLSYKKCKHGHTLNFLDCCLIDDYHCIQVLIEQITNYLTHHQNESDFNLGADSSER